MSTSSFVLGDEAQDIRRYYQGHGETTTHQKFFLIRIDAAGPPASHVMAQGTMNKLTTPDGSTDGRTMPPGHRDTVFTVDTVTGDDRWPAHLH